MNTGSSVGFERVEQGRLIAGVCAGMALRWDLDVTLVRLAFGVLVLASGLGLIVYGALWLLAPRQDASLSRRDFARAARDNWGSLRSEARHVGTELWDRAQGRVGPRPRWRRQTGLGLVAFGAFVLLASIGLFSWLGFGGTVGVVALLAGLAVLLGHQSE